jgi:hypothetical protein
MNRLLLVGLVATLVLSACGIASAVGSACERREDCEPGQVCLTAPAGFCSRGCTEPGQNRDCPAGTICSNFGQDQLVCSKPCQVKADCRVNYECSLTHPTGTETACRPAL